MLTECACRGESGSNSSDTKIKNPFSRASPPSSSCHVFSVHYREREILMRTSIRFEQVEKTNQDVSGEKQTAENSVVWLI